MFVRNGAPSIRRALESIRAQTYPNIEFIVQDGVSTDGTLDILRQYGERVQLVSEPDNGPSEGLWRALKRCNGEFIGSCLADEELLPDAVERAVALLQKSPDAGAITGDAILTDLAGKQTGFWKSGPFNFLDYLSCDYTPYFVSSFFRRQALIDAGLQAETWGMDCIEFELWCRLAARARVMYVPETFAKYASHAGQSSSNPRDATVHFRGRLELIATICTSSNLVGGDPMLRALSIWGHARAFINHALAVGRPELAQALFEIAKDVAGRFPPVDLDGFPYDEAYVYRRTARAAWTDLLQRTPSSVKKLVGQPRLQQWSERFQAALVAARFSPSTDAPSSREALMTALGRRDAAPAGPAIVLPPPPPPEMKARMYARLAQGYESEGRFQEASETWRAAARLVGLIPPVPPEERVGYTAA
ncbi:glycosyltransferase [Enhydrobacter aerosaccus]|nr:glycosyltransferase [Enhydrobacter aerosaccus]